MKDGQRKHNEDDRESFKAINERLDRVGDVAYRAQQAIVEEKKQVEIRHAENQLVLVGMAKDILFIRNKLYWIIGVFTGVGIAIGFAATWLKDRIIH